jgi:hypothetical protein
LEKWLKGIGERANGKKRRLIIWRWGVRMRTMPNAYLYLIHFHWDDICIYVYHGVAHFTSSISRGNLEFALNYICDLVFSNLRYDSQMNECIFLLAQKQFGEHTYTFGYISTDWVGRLPLKKWQCLLPLPSPSPLSVLANYLRYFWPKEGLKL